MKKQLLPVFRFLTGRLARNVYLWAFMLWTVFDINYNNEQAYHHGIIYSSWYLPFMLIGCVMQFILLYGNNLFLIPQLLARKKYVSYFLSASILVIVISVFYTVWLKWMHRHIDVNKLQQIGFVTSPITDKWTLGMMINETMTYLFGNAMWVFIFTMAWYMNDYSRQQKIAERAQKQQIETELHFLKNQLNPHFLFNTLNNLYALSLKKDDLTPDAILKLSIILRYLLHESNQPRVSFNREKEIMQAYIDLELLRLKNKDMVIINIENDRDYQIPPLLWLPILENVFKYGTRIIDEHNKVYFTCTIINNKLTIISRNLYKPLAVNATGEGGIGLANLKKRLDLLYHNSYAMNNEVRNSEFISSVTIEHL